MTITEAKKLCTTRNGRLPRPGHMMLIEEGERREQHFDRHGRGPAFYQQRFETWLANDGDTYRIEEYCDINSVPFI